MLFSDVKKRIKSKGSTLEIHWSDKPIDCFKRIDNRGLFNNDQLIKPPTHWLLLMETINTANSLQTPMFLDGDLVEIELERDIRKVNNLINNLMKRKPKSKKPEPKIPCKVILRPKIEKPKHKPPVFVNNRPLTIKEIISWIRKGLTLEIDYEDYRDYFIYIAKMGFNNCGEFTSEDDLIDLINGTNLMGFSLILDGQTITVRKEKPISERADVFVSQKDNLENLLKFAILESTKKKRSCFVAVPYHKLNQSLYFLKGLYNCRFEYLSDISAVIWDTSGPNSYYDFDDDDDEDDYGNNADWKLEIHEHFVMSGHETVIIRPEKWN